jgi:hypothetical protein
MSVEVEWNEDGYLLEIACRDEKGLLHNDDGPALHTWWPCRKGNPRIETRRYYKHGHLHNEKGAAVLDWNRHTHTLSARKYFLDGVQYSFAEWERRVKGVKVTANGKTKYISEQSAKELGLI